ncbi:MAG: hypothetical protein ACI8TP_002204 [Acidimicrobiales bacterium]|jgi:hypothetical protein
MGRDSNRCGSDVDEFRATLCTMNRRMTRVAVALSLALLGFGFFGPSVAADPVDSQCDAIVGSAVIDAAAAAGVGTVLGTNNGLFVVDITFDPKGNLPDQVAVELADVDELQWTPGRDIASIFLVKDDHLFTDACLQTSPEVLQAWQPPQGSGGELFEVVGGDWGAYRTVGFGAAGDPVAYGHEPGRVIAISACADPSVIAELVALPDGTTEAALRSLDDFSIIDSGPMTAVGDPALTGVTCDAAVLGSLAVITLEAPKTVGLSSDGAGQNWLADANDGLTVSEGQTVTAGAKPPAPPELELAPPPTIGGWSPWLFVLGIVGAGAYLLKKAQDPAWRSSWGKPDNSRNAQSGRRREDSTKPGHFG